MKTRIISALLMLPLLLFIYYGGVSLLIATFIFSAIGMHEFYKGWNEIDIHPSPILGYISLTCLYTIIIWGEFFQNEQKVYAHLLLLWMCGTVMAGLFVGIFKKGLPVYDGLAMIIGAVYIGFFFSYIPLITRIEQYKKMIWLVFVAALIQDAGAYFVGVFLGKHRLCPDISPKKSIEGAIGGIISSAIGCGIACKILYPNIVIHGVIIGIIGGCFGILGDLTASCFKRKMGIKDFGNLIPGHGGIMDRFDSVLLVAPFVYYYILVVLRP